MINELIEGQGKRQLIGDGEEEGEEMEEWDDEYESDAEEDYQVLNNNEDVEDYNRWLLPSKRGLIDSPNVPTTAGYGKYTRLAGDYAYPVLEPPSTAIMARRTKKRRKVVKPNTSFRHDKMTYGPDKTFQLFPNLSMREHKIFKVKVQCVEEEVKMSVPNVAPFKELYETGSMSDLSKVYWFTTPSSGRAERARLHWLHFAGNMKYAHFVFVPKSDFAAYQSHWCYTHAIVALPDTMTDVEENSANGGVGFSRRFIERFAVTFGKGSYVEGDDLLVELKMACKDEDGNVHRLRDGEIKYGYATLADFVNQVERIGKTTKSCIS